MLRYIVVDDDSEQLNYLMDKLKLIPNTECAGTFSNPLEVNSRLQQTQVDIAFLDIEMPECSGLDLVRSLTTTPLIVFVTSHTQFALESYELDAVDYLVKPVSLERLLLCFRKIEKFRGLLHHSNHTLEFKNSNDPFFFIKENGNYVRIAYDEVLYAESQNNFIMLFLENGKKHLVLVNMKNFEEQVSSDYFIRISRTHIVNRNKITSFNTHAIHIGNLQFGIGTAYVDHFNSENFHLIQRYK
jgi:two-component system LytT family response regulator